MVQTGIFKQRLQHGPDQHQQEMDDGAQGLDRGIDPVSILSEKMMSKP